MIKLTRYNSDLTDNAKQLYEDVIARADSIQGFTKHTLLSSAGGRPIYGYSLGGEGKPCIIMDGSIHNYHEWKSAYSVLEVMRVVSDPQLYPEESEKILGLLDRYRFYFIPVVSPDSYVAGKMFNDNDVWINRNFDYMWSYKDVDNKGSEPFSEPESRNIRDVVLSENTAIYINTHTVGNSNDLVMMRPHRRLEINPIISNSLQLMHNTYSDYDKPPRLSTILVRSSSYNWSSSVKGAFGNVVGMVFEPGNGLTLQENRSLSVYGALTLMLNISDYLENNTHDSKSNQFFKDLGRYLDM